MKDHVQASGSDQAEVFLSGAYHRIRHNTIALSVVSTIATALLFGWRNGLGLAIASLVAYLNLIWLHHGSVIMVERMIASGGKVPTKFRAVLAFAGRYGLLIVIAYVILKGFPSMRVGFMVGLALPVLAATCEGVYEAYVTTKGNPE